MRKLMYLAIMAASTFLVVVSCKKSNNDSTDKTNINFDRKAMLTNISTNIIIPAYTAFQTTAVNLDAAVTAFNAAPDAAKLTTMQNAFIAAYEQWQSTSVFEVGPAATANLRVNTNTYPASVTQINANIAAGTYDPLQLANLSAKGLPAIDYLVSGVGADNAAILAQYTTAADAGKRKTYLAKLSAELKANATAVSTAWANYKTTFINADGTDVSSSVGQLMNQLVYDYEILKNQEIGIPVGTQSMGTTFPEKVQGYYSKISVQLVILHLQAVRDIYLGKSPNADGLGFDDYLVAANAKYSDGKALNDVIKAQFATALAKLQALSDPLPANIVTNKAAVTAAYTELQKLTVLLKTDATSSLGILITFGDNDGD